MHTRTCPHQLVRSVLLIAALGFGPSLWAQSFDTTAVIMGIEQRMNEVDQAPIGAVFLTYPEREEAVLLLPDSVVQGQPSERNEIYAGPDGSVAGIGTFLRSTYPGVTESSCHYFGADGHTIAVAWTLKWLKSQCTDSVAIETRYIYFYPIGEPIMEYATLTDQRGQRVDHTKCTFPDIERHMDAYYDRAMLLLSKHITFK
jgi:hypothetical protein